MLILYAAAWTSVLLVASECLVANDFSKRSAASALESPMVLANLEAKLDTLYGQFERLTAANNAGPI